MNNDLKIDLEFIISDLFDLWRKTEDYNTSAEIKEICDRLQKFYDAICNDETGSDIVSCLYEELKEE